MAAPDSSDVARLQAEQAKYEIGTPEYDALQEYVDQVKAKAAEPQISRGKAAATTAVAAIPGSMTEGRFHPSMEEWDTAYMMNSLGDGSLLKSLEERRAAAPAASKQFKADVAQSEHDYPYQSMGVGMAATLPFMSAGPLIAGAYGAEKAAERGGSAKDIAVSGGTSAAFSGFAGLIGKLKGVPKLIAAALGPPGIERVSSMLHRGEFEWVGENELMVGGTKVPVSLAAALVPWVGTMAYQGGKAVAGIPGKQQIAALETQGVEPQPFSQVKNWPARAAGNAEGAQQQNLQSLGRAAQEPGALRTASEELVSGVEGKPGILGVAGAKARGETAGYQAKFREFEKHPITPQVLDSTIAALDGEIASLSRTSTRTKSEPITYANEPQISSTAGPGTALIPRNALARRSEYTPPVGEARPAQEAQVSIKTTGAARLGREEDVAKLERARDDLINGRDSGEPITFRELNDIKSFLTDRKAGVANGEQIGYRLNELWSGSGDPQLAKIVEAQRTRAAERNTTKEAIRPLIGSAEPGEVIVLDQIAKDIDAVLGPEEGATSRVSQIPGHLDERADNAIHAYLKESPTGSKIKAANVEKALKYTNLQEKANTLKLLTAMQELEMGTPSLAMRTSSATTPPTLRVFSFFNPKAIGTRMYAALRDLQSILDTATGALPAQQEVARRFADEKSSENKKAAMLLGNP